MSFAQSLQRLKDAIENPPPGRHPGITIVDKKDLRELLYHFEWLDNEARQRHFDRGIALSEGRPDINIEKIIRGDETIYQAHIIGMGFDHHGEEGSPSQALLHAARHWARHEHEKSTGVI